jgi:hypothetical protein
MFVEERFGVLFHCSAGRAEISIQRNQKNRAPRVLWLQAKKIDVHRIHVFHKAFYGAEKNPFASLSQSIRRAWFRLFGEVPLQRSPFNDPTSG